MYKYKLFDTTYNIILQWGTYLHGGRTFLYLVDADTGEDFADVTINIIGAHLEPDEVIIKNEVEQTLEFLQENKIVGPVLRTVKSGWNEYPVCKLLIYKDGKTTSKEETPGIGVV
jgi:hypothetical protein